MKIGKYTLEVINSGFFSLDGGAMFGIVPKPLWEKTNPADSKNRIKLATRNLLLIDGKRKILIDTGMGDKWNEKNRNIYDIQQNEFSLISGLKRIGLQTTDITDVILTHLHFDHTGGSTIFQDGKLYPAFPNAKYYVQKKNFEWALNSSEKDKGSYIKDNFVPLMDAGILNLLERENLFDDEIECLEINGHTFGQQLIKISDSSNTFLYCADLFPTKSHLPLPYVMGYDLQPLITIEEKKKILKLATEEDWKLFFEHDQSTAYCTISSTEMGYRINEEFDAI